MTAVRAVSPVSQNLATPLRCAPMGPTFNLTVPRYSSPSRPVIAAPGRHGATWARSLSSSQVRSTPAEMTNSLASFIATSHHRALGKALDNFVGAYIEERHNAARASLPAF